MEHTERPVTVPELSARTGVSADTIRWRCRQGQITGAYRVGGSWLIPPAAADRFAEQYRPWGRLTEGDTP